MKRLYAAIACLIVLGFTASRLSAQAAAPQPGPEVKKLDYFVGNWKLDGEAKPGPAGPGGKISGTEQNEWHKGGFFLVCRNSESGPMGSFASLNIYGYDSANKVYSFDQFNNVGEKVHATGALADDTWTWNTELKAGGATIKARFVQKILSPTTYNFKFEISPDGTNWSTILEGKATKTS